ncbi:MAG: replication-relaxation family protein [Candidatus Saccharimonadales bacterium]
MPKYRRPLNDKQILILKTLYKFRFINVELMCRTGRRYERDVMRKRLRTLLDQEYIGREYDSSDRQQNKFAVYHLMPNGIRALAGLPGLNPSVLHAAYRDRSASEQFINHSLNIFYFYRQFEWLYPRKFMILTKSETAGYDYYPKYLPDIHLADTKGQGDFFLDIIETDTRPVVIRNKLSGYSSHCDEGTWEETTNEDYPRLLLVCATPSIERGLQRRAPRLLNNQEISTYTTSFKALLGARSAKDKIWTDVDEPEELIIHPNAPRT